MQAYAEGWELLEKVDLVDNVTEVFRSWREGTVIRSWLLDLLVAALDDDPGLAKIRGYAEDSGEGRWTVEAGIDNAVADAGDHRRAVRPLRLPPGRLPGDEGDRRDAQPVRRPRRARPAPPPGGDAADRLTATRAPVYVAHLALHDFRSYADVEVALAPGATAFVGRNGQGKTNLVEAIDYLSRLGSHRVATDAPLVRAGAEQAVVRAAVVRDGRTRRARGRDQPGPLQPGPGQPLAAAAGPRPARPGPHGGLLARGPDPGQGRPVRPAPVPRRPAGAAHAAAGRRPRRLRPGAQAAQLAAQDRRRCAPRRSRREAGAVDARRSGTPTWPGSAPSCSRTGWRWSTTCGPTSARPTRPSPAARPRDDAEIDYKPSFELARRTAADRGALTEALLAELERRRSDELDRGISLVGPHRDELLLTLGSRRARPGCRSRATPATASRGRSRSRCGWRRTTCCAPTATTRS